MRHVVFELFYVFQGRSALLAFNDDRNTDLVDQKDSGSRFVVEDRLAHDSKIRCKFIKI